MIEIVRFFMKTSYFWYILIVLLNYDASQPF